MDIGDASTEHSSATSVPSGAPTSWLGTWITGGTTNQKAYLHSVSLLMRYGYSTNQTTTAEIPHLAPPYSPRGLEYLTHTFNSTRVRCCFVQR